MTTPAELRALAEPSFDADGNSSYDPCCIGLHICGAAAQEGSNYEQPYTALNLPARSHAMAKAMFAAARAEAECSKDEHDFVCDLNLGIAGRCVDHVDDFYTNRQLIPRLIAAASATISEQNP